MSVQTASLAELLALEVPRDQVPHETRAAAFEALLAVGTSLGLKPFPSLKFLPPAVGRRFELRGIVHPEAPSTVWVVVQPPADVTETVCHEALHVQQINRWGSYVGEPNSPFSMASRETAATSFGLAIRARYEQGRKLVDPQPKRPAPARPAPARRVAPPARPPVTTGRRYRAVTEAEAAGVERRSRMYTRRGLRWINCEHCSEPAQIGVTHRCSAAGRPVPRPRP
jgi:hypothetical protein